MEPKAASARCRVCLSTAAQRRLLPLDTHVPRLALGVTHLECLRNCTQLEVPIGAESIQCDFKYPMQICMRCSKALQVAHHFIRLACETDAVLRAQYAEAAQVRQIKDELMEVEQAAQTTTRPDFVDLSPFFKEITSEDAAAQEQAQLLTNPKNAFNTQFSDFVKSYAVTPPLDTSNLEETIAENPSLQTNPNTHDCVIRNDLNTVKAEVEVKVRKMSIEAKDFSVAAAQRMQTSSPNCEDAVAPNIEDKAETSTDAAEQECNKDDTLEDAIKILTQTIESAAQDGDKSSERDVLATIANHSSTPTAKTSVEHAALSDTATKFIEEIKENLTNGARDYALLRNKTRVCVETEELQQAFESKEAEIDDNNELLCVLCDKRFTDMRTFIRHRNRHKGITPFRCNTCNFFTCYSESLRKHYKREHNFDATNEMLNISIDPKNAPMEKPYVEKTHQCTLCDFETHKYESIRDHIDIKHPMMLDFDSPVDSLIATSFNCPDCHRVFKDQRSMRTHFTFMHGSSLGIRKLSTETYICEHCDKQFNHKVSLVSHQRVCRLREAVCCHICNKKLISMRVFEQHLRADHNVETIHECEVCSKTFNSRESLFMHRKRHTERHYQCTLCPKTYINNSELNVHVARTHCSGANVLCRLCGQTFTHLRLLREHEQKAHYRKLHRCQRCEYTSPWRCALRLHEYIHTGKPYICATCGRQFALRSYLRRHSIKAHSITPTDEEMAEMFRKKFGYPSRYDAFCGGKNALEISEVNEDDIEQELKEFGLKFEDIVNDLFENGVEEELFNLSG